MLHCFLSLVVFKLEGGRPPPPDYAYGLGGPSGALHEKTAFIFYVRKIIFYAIHITVNQLCLLCIMIFETFLFRKTITCIQFLQYR